MKKKGEIKLGILIMVFIGLIVALSLLTPIFNTQNLMTDKQTGTNQSTDVSGSYVNGTFIDESVEYTIFTQSTWKQTGCPLTSVALRNGASTALVNGTDYILNDGTGVFTLLNTTKTVPSTSDNITYVDYTYCADGYNTDSGSRSIARLIGLFAVLALLAFVFLGLKNDWF